MSLKNSKTQESKIFILEIGLFNCALLTEFVGSWLHHLQVNHPSSTILSNITHSKGSVRGSEVFLSNLASNFSFRVISSDGIPDEFPAVNQANGEGGGPREDRKCTHRTEDFEAHVKEAFDSLKEGMPEPLLDRSQLCEGLARVLPRRPSFRTLERWVLRGLPYGRDPLNGRRVYRLSEALGWYLSQLDMGSPAADGRAEARKCLVSPPRRPPATRPQRGR